MEKFEFSRVINLIQNKEMDQALKILFNKLSSECIPLIKSKARNLSQNEAMGIFYYAFLDLCERIHSGKFEFQNDNKFVSYFKTSCVNQTYNTVKKDTSPVLILPDEVLLMISNECDTNKRKSQRDFIQEKKKRYGVEIQINEEDGYDYLGEVVRVYHLLSEKCKIIILLKFFVKLKHEEIADTLSLFYEVNSPDVSRMILSRCIQQIREKVVFRD